MEKYAFNFQQIAPKCFDKNIIRGSKTTAKTAKTTAKTSIITFESKKNFSGFEVLLFEIVTDNEEHSKT